MTCVDWKKILLGFAQPSLLNNLNEGLIVAENLLEPEGLTPFETPPCPVSTSMNNAVNEESSISFGNFMISQPGESLSAAHGNNGRSNFIIPVSFDHVNSR